MGKIFYVMGKSSTGKDTIFKKILEREELALRNFVLYTTRPIRAKETNGVEYYFVDENRLAKFETAGKIVEMRAYDTVHGVWNYFTVDDGQVDLKQYNYLAIGTLVSYEKVRAYFGKEQVVPIYIEVADDNRLERALKRERKQKIPKYEELCRRFLADSQDFSEEYITQAGIERRFLNNMDRQECVEEVAKYIGEILHREFTDNAKKNAR